MKNFGDLSRKDQLELFSAWLDGKTIEYHIEYDTWVTCDMPYWYEKVIYRVKPEPKIPDSINWDHVASEYSYMVRQPGGAVLLSTEKPCKCIVSQELHWRVPGKYVNAGCFKSLVIGNLPWDQSLVERPNK